MTAAAALDGASQSRRLCRFGATFSLSLLQAGSSPVSKSLTCMEQETLTRDTPPVVSAESKEKSGARTNKLALESGNIGKGILS